MALKLADAAGSFTDINMTPLIDVMLVLLIIFIISLPPVTHAVKIDNPVPTTPPPLRRPPVVVDLGIDFDGTLSWNGSPVDRTTLLSYITEQAGDDPQPEVHLTVDKFAKYAKVAETLADLQSRGLTKIGVINNEPF